jgi:hypothetical protein
MTVGFGFSPNLLTFSIGKALAGFFTLKVKLPPVGNFTLP